MLPSQIVDGKLLRPSRESLRPTSGSGNPHSEIINPSAEFLTPREIAAAAPGNAISQPGSNAPEPSADAPQLSAHAREPSVHAPGLWFDPRSEAPALERTCPSKLQLRRRGCSAERPCAPHAAPRTKRSFADQRATKLEPGHEGNKPARLAKARQSPFPPRHEDPPLPPSPPKTLQG